jgi:parallel beta-helix repeat protein
VIRDNQIHHVMQTLSDGGGIYTLGRQPGTVLSGNVIHDIQINSGRAESNGIFMDEGSTDIRVENNTFYGIARAGIRYNEAGKNTVANNRLDGALGGAWQPPSDDASIKKAGPHP